MSEAFACLVVADESAEFPAALTYAAQLAKSTSWRLVMLHVIEPSDPGPWASVTEEIRRQAMSTAESLTQRFVAEVWAECGVTPEAVIREGDLRHEIRKLMDEDESIKLAVIASAHGAGGPGVLVTSLSKGQGLGGGGRSVPVIVVPGVLTKDEIRALALPVPAPEVTPSA